MVPRKTVLVVSGDPAVHRGAREALAGGYDLRFATSAEEAFRLARSEDVHCILLDIGLPRGEWGAFFLYVERMGIPVVLVGDEADRPGIIVIGKVCSQSTSAPGEAAK